MTGQDGLSFHIVRVCEVKHTQKHTYTQTIA